MREIPLANGRGVVLVDDDDFEFLSRFRWRLHNRGYAFTGPRTLFMHRLILGARRGEQVDHVNRDPRDNRRANLRRCDQAQNMANSRHPIGRNGFRGVLRLPRGPNCPRFLARLRVRGRVVRGGVYTTPEAAARAYDELARQHNGEFARLNFPRDNEQAA